MGLFSRLFGKQEESAPSTGGRTEVRRRKPEESSAGAYLRGDRIILHGYCDTNIGGLACEPYRTVEAGVSDADLGAALLGVLEEARTVPVPSDRKAEQEKLVQGTGVRSWGDLSRGAIHCSVTQTPAEISILPTAEEDGGFTHVPEETVRVAAASTPEQIGKALRDGFQRCA